MRILVIDAQGGGVGKQLVSKIKAEIKDVEVVAVGTNALATSAMLKAGADVASTGENSIVYSSARADLIVGPMGIAMPNAMNGEITPRMAEAVSGARAARILIPFRNCDHIMVGVKDLSVSALVDLAVEEIKNMV